MPPDEISLYDILVAVEGHCLHLSGNFQGRSGRRLKQVWNEISETLVEKTKSYTLEPALLEESDRDVLHLSSEKLEITGKRF